MCTHTLASTSVNSANRDPSRSHSQFKSAESGGPAGPHARFRLLSGYTDAWVLSLHQSKCYILSKRLMTWTGSRPLVLLCSYSNSWLLLDWQNTPLMWWSKNSISAEGNLFFREPRCLMMCLSSDMDNLIICHILFYFYLLPVQE